MRKSGALSRRQRHERLSAKPVHACMQPYSEMLSYWMVEMDDPDHARLRTAISRWFGSEAVSRLRPRIEALAEELLGKIKGSGHDDLIADFAFPLPLLVMFDIVGVPREAYASVLEWSRAFSDIENRRPSIELYAKASSAAVEFHDYLFALAQERSREPKNDLLSELVTTRKEHHLTEEEVIGTVMLLLFAGHETTASVIGNGIYTLLRHTEQLALLRAFPARVGTAVDEIIRYECPVQSVSIGHLSTDLQLRGRAMRSGDRLMTVLASANRDENVFESPEKFDITRGTRRHVGFGTGLHHCVGAALARLEGEVAISSLLQRFPGLVLADSAPMWREGLLTRGLSRLTVSYE